MLGVKFIARSARRRLRNWRKRDGDKEARENAKGVCSFCGYKMDIVLVW